MTEKPSACILLTSQADLDAVDGWNLDLWRYKLERTGRTKRSISSRLGHYRVDRRRSGKATAAQPLAPNLFHHQFSLLVLGQCQRQGSKKKHSGFFAADEPCRSLYAGTSSTSTASGSRVLSSPLFEVCRRCSSDRFKQGPLESIADALLLKGKMLLWPSEKSLSFGPTNAVCPPTNHN